ncbi:MAG: zinc ABC transporter substrate-binding protein [Rouxiella aceris]|uniref:metal ABC transporter solute-binding protein, Zn/Mn family n=1 Tax=Rouxiella aceris TaxID=2703884 RepID=UPI00284608A0|nr:zinc ABC transporter substrate-binding protein [Rouxiella aceris]MDR3434941.1 zinc ABC transporter substrate-binding protein [Rouxiella aceris]
MQRKLKTLGMIMVLAIMPTSTTMATPVPARIPALAPTKIPAHTPPPAPAPVVLVNAIGVENQYADVIAKIGGKFVHVTAINADTTSNPHNFQATPQIAAEIAHADLVVKNGLGYDAWVDPLIAAATNPKQQVINVQQLMGVAENAPNPHLWYKPETMPAVAKRIAEDLSRDLPTQKAYFEANVKIFDLTLAPWQAAITRLKSHYAQTEVAVTDSVGNDLLEAADLKIVTPVSLQMAIMKGIEPTAEDISAQTALFADGKVKIFIYNPQVISPLTEGFLFQARQQHIPVVSLYETLPVPGYHYPGWMIAETNALLHALTSKASTESLFDSHY